MIWTREDEMALASCYECRERCRRYSVTPAPVFRTLLRAYEELERAGLIQREGDKPKDLCAGCAEEINGGCRRGYQTATLSLDGTRVVKCLMRRERRDRP